MQQPWRDHLPAVSGPGADADADIAVTAPSLLVRAGAGVVLASGMVTLLTGIQTTLLVTIRGPMALAPWALFALGATTVVSAVLVWRMRGWGAIAATVLCAFQVLVTTAWLFYSFMHGLFSLYALGAPMASVIGAVFAGVAIGPCLRASAARARLAAQGFDFGL